MTSACDGHILKIWRASGENGVAQGTDLYPRPGGQFEIFCNPTIETDAAFGCAIVMRASEIAGVQKTSIVHVERRQTICIDVARRKVGASKPDFERVAIYGCESYGMAGEGKANFTCVCCGLVPEAHR